jgi:hypothetical protein
MADVQHLYPPLLLPHAVNDSVDVWIVTVQEVPQLTTLNGRGAPMWMLF